MILPSAMVPRWSIPKSSTTAGWTRCWCILSGRARMASALHAVSCRATPGRTGRVISRSKIPQATLNELVDIVSAQFFLICAKWKEFFAVDEIAFYC